MCYILARICWIDDKELLAKENFNSKCWFISGIYKDSIAWIKSVGGVIVKKDLIQVSTSNEWDGGQLGLVIEFESKFAAKKAFYSEVFQKYLQSRDLMELVTISTL